MRLRFKIVTPVLAVLGIGTMVGPLFTKSKADVGSPVSSVALSPNGQRLAIGYKNEKATLRLVEIKTGKTLRELNGKPPEEPDRVASLAFSRDGKTLACGYSGRFGDAVNLWDVSTFKLKRVIKTGGQSVAFSRDDRLLATGGAEWRASTWSAATQIWEAKSGKLKRTLRRSGGRPREETVRSLALSPDVNTLVTANDVADSKAQMLTMDAVVTCWNTKTGKMRWSFKELVSDPLVAFSPRGGVLANTSGQSVKVREALTGRVLRVLKTSNPSWFRPTAMTFSPDGVVLVVGTDSNTTTLWNVRTGALLRTLGHHLDSISSVAYSSDGKHLAVGSKDHSVSVWDTRTWQFVSSIGRPQKPAQNPFS